MFLSQMLQATLNGGLFPAFAPAFLKAGPKFAFLLSRDTLSNAMHEGKAPAGAPRSS
jgi:hypothetical protein